MTAVDRPSVTDAARAEAERRYNSAYLPSDLTYPAHALESHRRGAFVAGAEWAAGRAETTTATTEDAARVINAELVRQVRGELIELVADDDMECERSIARALAAHGLLATARTRPTRKELVVAIRVADLRYTDNGMAVTVGDYADAVLALLTDQPTEAEAGARAVSEMGDWFMRQGFDRDVTAAQACYERAARLRGGAR